MPTGFRADTDWRIRTQAVLTGESVWGRMLLLGFGMLLFQTPVCETEEKRKRTCSLYWHQKHNYVKRC